jgi:hypothetical protein
MNFKKKKLRKYLIASLLTSTNIVAISLISSCSNSSIQSDTLRWAKQFEEQTSKTSTDLLSNEDTVILLSLFSDISKIDGVTSESVIFKQLTSILKIESKYSRNLQIKEVDKTITLTQASIQGGSLRLPSFYIVSGSQRELVKPVTIRYKMNVDQKWVNDFFESYKEISHQDAHEIASIYKKIVTSSSYNQNDGNAFIETITKAYGLEKPTNTFSLNVVNNNYKFIDNISPRNVFSGQYTINLWNQELAFTWSNSLYGEIKYNGTTTQQKKEISYATSSDQILVEKVYEVAKYWVKNTLTNDEANELNEKLVEISREIDSGTRVKKLYEAFSIIDPSIKKVTPSTGTKIVSYSYNVNQKILRTADEKSSLILNLPTFTLLDVNSRRVISPTAWDINYHEEQEISWVTNLTNLFSSRKWILNNIDGLSLNYEIAKMIQSNGNNETFEFKPLFDLLVNSVKNSHPDFLVSDLTKNIKESEVLDPSNYKIVNNRSKKMRIVNSKLVGNKETYIDLLSPSNSGTFEIDSLQIINKKNGKTYDFSSQKRPFIVNYAAIEIDSWLKNASDNLKNINTDSTLSNKKFMEIDKFISRFSVPFQANLYSFNNFKDLYDYVNLLFSNTSYSESVKLNSRVIDSIKLIDPVTLIREGDSILGENYLTIYNDLTLASRRNTIFESVSQTSLKFAVTYNKVNLYIYNKTFNPEIAKTLNSSTNSTQETLTLEKSIFENLIFKSTQGVTENQIRLRYNDSSPLFLSAAFKGDSLFQFSSSLTHILLQLQYGANSQIKSVSDKYDYKYLLTSDFALKMLDELSAIKISPIYGNNIESKRRALTDISIIFSKYLGTPVVDINEGYYIDSYPSWVNFLMEHPSKNYLNIIQIPTIKIKSTIVNFENRDLIVSRDNFSNNATRVYPFSVGNPSTVQDYFELPVYGNTDLNNSSYYVNWLSLINRKSLIDSRSYDAIYWTNGYSGKKDFIQRRLFIPEYQYLNIDGGNATVRGQSRIEDYKFDVERVLKIDSSIYRNVKLNSFMTLISSYVGIDSYYWNNIYDYYFDEEILSRNISSFKISKVNEYSQFEIELPWNCIISNSGKLSLNTSNPFKQKVISSEKSQIIFK